MNMRIDKAWDKELSFSVYFMLDLEAGFESNDCAVCHGDIARSPGAVKYIQIVNVSNDEVAGNSSHGGIDSLLKASARSAGFHRMMVYHESKAPVSDPVNRASKVI
jgi:hypothetical protein